jgi:hypothetical protein
MNHASESMQGGVMIGRKPKISGLVLGAKNMIEAADVRAGDSVLLLADRSSDPDSMDAIAATLRFYGAQPMEFIGDPILRYRDVPAVFQRLFKS